MSVETVTILMTDLVGSTELESRVAPAVVDELRREYFALLREVVRESGGAEVKNTGDGLMVAFRSSSSAVDCAIAMQQRMARRNRSSPEPLRVRIGLGTGDATVEDHDYFGMPSIEAARLCDKAGADRILVSEPVSMLARRSGDVFAPVGQLNLKGIPEPVSAFEVRWDRTDSRGAVPLPRPLVAENKLPFVGRVDERAAVAAAWQSVAAGSGQVVLISGEPGSGKTRLMIEAARAAHADGATVLFGRCREELGTPYQPLLQAVRHYATAVPAARLAPLLEHVPILIRLAPELVSVLPEIPPPADPERRSEQRLLSDAVRAVLASAAVQAPTVLVLDDLHWASRPLLTILGGLADALAAQPVLLLVAYRDTEVGTEDPLSDLLVDLRRNSYTERLTLLGFATEEVVDLLKAGVSDGSTAGSDLAGEVVRFTAGSPLLVGELLSAVPAVVDLARIVSRTEPWDVGADGLPDSVREHVRARVNRLSQAARHVLETAAVVGHLFETDLVAAISGLPEADSLAALDEALAAGLLRSTEESSRFSFTSPALRHSVYADLPTPHRLRLHRALAERLEADGDRRLTETAEHWFVAAATAGSGGQHRAKATDIAERAGQAANARCDYSLAGRQYRHAAQLVAASEASSPRHCELLLAAGDAYARAGEVEAAKRAFNGAAEIARRVGDGHLLATAALGYGMGPGEASYVLGADETLIGLLEQALAGLKADDDALRVQILSRLAVELHLTGFAERREALSREAVELAKKNGDPAAELLALHGWLRATWSADELSGRLAGSEDTIRRAVELGDQEMAHRGHLLRFRALLEVGDMTGVDEELRALEQTASLIGKPLVVWQHLSACTTRAQQRAEAHAAQRLMNEMREVGRRAHPVLGERTLQAQLALQQWLVGTPRELIPILRAGVQSCPWLAVRRARLAFGFAELGRKTEASAEFEHLAQDDFAALPRDGSWLMTIAFLAFACASLCDTDRARHLQGALEPYGDRFLVSGDGSTTWGPVSTALAVLAATLANYDDAADLFERALEQCEQTGAEAQRIFAAREYARMLTRRGRVGDQDRASALLREARSSCERRRLVGLAEQLASV